MFSEYELKKDTKLLGDIQFKLNRLALAEMHYAVDRYVIFTLLIMLFKKRILYYF